MNNKSELTPEKSSPLLVPAIIVGIIAVVLITWMMYNWAMSTFGAFGSIPIIITFGLDAFVFILCIAIGLGIKW